MGCNASKPGGGDGGDNGYLLAKEGGGGGGSGHSHKDMMKADPTVTQAAAQMQRSVVPPPQQHKPPQPQAPPNGHAPPPQQKTFNRAKDRVEAIKESKAIHTKDIRCRYAYFSQRGFYPDDPFKPNQDSFCVHEAVSQITNNQGVVRMDSLFGVFDGHGKDGHHCARYTRHHLPGQLKRALERARSKQDGAELNRDQIHHAVVRAHVETNRMLHQNPQIDDSLSGTTAISIYFHGRRNRVTIANVGDSRCVLGSTTGPPVSSIGHNGAPPESAPTRSMLKAQPLSRDQTPYRKDERVRIKKTGARILSLDQLEGLEPINEESENGEELELGEELDEGGDPPRVWAPNGDYPGTAFTRSIGDAMAEELGVFAEPEMLSRELKPNDKILVCASDGVFEFLTNQSVIDICAKFNDPLEACRAVVAEAYELWLQYELRTDDITIIVIFIDEIRNDPASRRPSGSGSYASSKRMNFGLDAKGMQKELEAELEDDDEEDEESDEEFEEQTIHTSGVKPVRKNVSKEKSKEIAKLKAQGAKAAAQDNEPFDIKKLATPKTDAEKESIEEAIKASVMFRNVTHQQREMIYQCMESVKVKEGEWVIKQGSVGDKYYIIDEGQFEVRILPDGVKDETGEGGNIIHLYEGSRKLHIHPSFGELALMYSAPRSASIIAKSDGHLWALHRSAFRQVLTESKDDRKDLKKVLEKIPYFQYCDSDAINKIATMMDEVSFGRGENIAEQGFPGKTMYVMKNGSCYSMEMSASGTKRGTLKAKSFFGDEIFSNSDGLYGKTVVSLQTTTCWALDRATAEKTMKPIIDLSESSDKKSESSSGKHRKSSKKSSH
eukprot:CAMPEP_0168853754 /NCGR_PEP_ID=MMETSP0727-20121128/13696_1 /TAXON_ID=265536 /ORGANISM="Amphiprora sp., Strain CCMP467" /LENGTH=834 /DNA_ID=CAMNT_0008907999 /DNA_START=445 /DNA_END=2949 /DNA_ORIENTATION=-